MASVPHNDRINHQQAMIELRDVALSFGAETLLKKVNLKISRGEAYVLIGPSGQGKTTLLKLMTGLFTPTKGEVLVEGKSWEAMRSSDRAKLVRRMGMLFQKNALFDSLTCAENVAFPMRETTSLPESKIQETVRYFLDAVGLSHAYDLYPDEISGGMQKRLGIARALALRPEIVFYDDPTAGLDPITSRKIVTLIKDLQRTTNMTLIAVTNDMYRAYQMADRIGMIIGGEFIDCGTEEQTKAVQDPRVQQFIHGSLEGPLTEKPV